MVPIILNPLIAMMSLSTATGVLLHDMHLDKATLTVLSAPAVAANYDTGTKAVSLGTDPHVHTERGSLSQAVGDLKFQHPRIQPRTQEDKKYLLQKHVRKGSHPFDSYHLPLGENL